MSHSLPESPGGWGVGSWPAHCTRPPPRLRGAGTAHPSSPDQSGDKGWAGQWPGALWNTCYENTTNTQDPGLSHARAVGEDWRPVSRGRAGIHRQK